MTMVPSSILTPSGAEDSDRSTIAYDKSDGPTLPKAAIDEVAGGENDLIIVDWDGPTDPENPRK